MYATNFTNEDIIEVTVAYISFIHNFLITDYYNFVKKQNNQKLKFDYNNLINLWDKY